MTVFRVAQMALRWTASMAGQHCFLNCSVAFCFVLKSVFEDLRRFALFGE